MANGKLITPPDEYAYDTCRSDGHSWAHAKKLTKHPFFTTIFGRRSTCRECGSKRIRWTYKNGELHSRQYDYAPGYQLGKMDNKPSLQVWRRVYMETLDIEGDV
jgi:hypothetical protein